MKKTPEINNGSSMEMMLTLAIVMANGSNRGTRYKPKRVLRNTAGLTVSPTQSSIS